MSLTMEQTNELFLRYLKEVKGLEVKGEEMIYLIKFTRYGIPYEAEVKNVKTTNDALIKLKQYAGDDLKIQKIKCIAKTQKITID